MEISVNIVLNGERRQVASESSLLDILEGAGLPVAQGGIAVALNDRVIPRDEWADAIVRDADRIEVIHAVQGG